MGAEAQGSVRIELGGRVTVPQRARPVTEPARSVWGRPSIGEHPEHDHGLRTVEGYVVRVTVRGGRVLEHRLDVALYLDARLYGRALDHARQLRGPSGWAVVDALYVCGCRS